MNKIRMGIWWAAFIFMLPLTTNAQVELSDYWRDALSLKGATIDTSNITDSWILVYEASTNSWVVAANQQAASGGSAYADSANLTGPTRYDFDDIYTTSSTMKFGLSAADGSPASVLTINNDGKVIIDNAPQSGALAVDGIIESETNGFKFPDGTIQTTAVAAQAFDANTLDEAYDEGGAGAGRAITADAGRIVVTGDVEVTDSLYVGNNIYSTGHLDIDTFTSTGLVTINSFKMASGATNGYVLTTDGSGNGTWQSVSAAAGSFTGTGDKWYLPYFTSDTTLAKSVAFQDSATSFIGIIGDTAEYALDVEGDIRATEFVRSKTSKDVSSDSLVLSISFNKDALVDTFALDASLWGNHAREQDGTSTTGFNGGGAMTFDGSDDYYLVSDDASLQFSTGITMSAWVKITDETGGDPLHIIIGKDTWRLYQPRGEVDFTGHLYIGGVTYTPMIGDDLNKSQWYHICVTFDGDTIRTFLDGEHLTLGAGSSASEIVVNGTIGTNSGTHVAIGGSHTGGSLFDGDIDEIQIYARGMDDNEVKRLYLQGLERVGVYTPQQYVFTDADGQVGIGEQYEPATDLDIDGSTLISNHLGVYGGDVTTASYSVDVGLSGQSDSYGIHVDATPTGTVTNGFGLYVSSSSGDATRAAYGALITLSSSSTASHVYGLDINLTTSGSAVTSKGFDITMTGTGGGVHTMYGGLMDINGYSTFDLAYGLYIDFDVATANGWALWIESNKYAMKVEAGDVVFNTDRVGTDLFTIQGKTDDSLMVADYYNNMVAFGYSSGGRPSSDSAKVAINGDLYVNGNVYYDSLQAVTAGSFYNASEDSIILDFDSENDDTGTLEWRSGGTKVGEIENDGDVVFQHDLTADKFMATVATITTSSDAVSVATVSVLNVDTAGGDVTIGGFTGGEANQILWLYNSDTNNVILEDDEGTGNQDIKTNSAADVTITAEGGAILIYDGTDGFWRIIGVAL